MTYHVIGHARLQTARPLADMAEVVLYRDETDGVLWARAAGEFEDGRFERLPAPAPDATASFQSRVQPWLMECFGPEIAGDREERNHRFLEEALELVQAKGCARGEAHQLVDYVFGRPTGIDVQEVGGVMVTLAALCLASHLDMHEAGEIELARIWTKVDKIRAKQATKPKHSPLPEPAPDATAPDADAIDELLRLAEAAPMRISHADGALNTTNFYHAVRNAIPSLPAYIARREAEARRKALEEAAKIADDWLDDATQRHLTPGDSIRLLIDKEPQS